MHVEQKFLFLKIPKGWTGWICSSGFSVSAMKFKFIFVVSAVPFNFYYFLNWWTVYVNLTQWRNWTLFIYYFYLACTTTNEDINYTIFVTCIDLHKKICLLVTGNTCADVDYCSSSTCRNCHTAASTNGFVWEVLASQLALCGFLVGFSNLFCPHCSH